MSGDTKKAPHTVRPYVCHGVKLEDMQGEWLGVCPFCSKHKFYVNEENGMYNCKVCGVAGNQYTFLTSHAIKVAKETSPQKLKEFCKNRGSTKIGRKEHLSEIPLKVMRSFGVGWDGERRQWLIPIYNKGGKTVSDIRRYNNGQVMATSGIKLQLGGLDRLEKLKKGTVWLCEGEFDAIALQWLLTELKVEKENCVTWVPGANVLKGAWASHFKNKNVIAVYDNDRTGDDGQLRCYKFIKSVANSLSFVNWPDSKPSGYDLRDYIVRSMATGTPPEVTMEGLIVITSDLPRRSDEVEIRTVEGEEAEEEDLEPASFEEVLAVYQKYVLMNQDMIDALKVCLAICLSNEVPNDPLWVYLIGPPGSGKTLLLSALQESKRTKFVSTITAHSLVSGWRGGGSKDPSLIPKLKGRTFVAKDFTEILTMPAMVQDDIFSTLRGAYDGYVQRPFGNGVMREYKDCHFSMIAGVTHAVHGHAKASLGERFIKFQMNPPSGKASDDIVMAAMMSVGKEKNIEQEMQEITKRYLSQNKEGIPEVPLPFAERLTALVQLIAAMRAQVERDFRGEEVMYRPVAESGTRLAKQLVKLAMMLAKVENKTVVDEGIFKIVQKTAYDTAYGFHLDIISAMMELGESATKAEIADKVELPGSTLNRRMDDLIVLKAIRLTDFDKKHGKTGGRPSRVYEVTKRIGELWKKAQVTDKTQPTKRKVLRRKRKQ